MGTASIASFARRARAGGNRDSGFFFTDPSAFLPVNRTHESEKNQSDIVARRCTVDHDTGSHRICLGCPACNAIGRSRREPSQRSDIVEWAKQAEDHGMVLFLYAPNELGKLTPPGAACAVTRREWG